jgi:glycosyltransferase involved in cell wall biosynthesis
MKTGILFPAYNEEKNIQVVIKEAKKYLPNSEIVVVDDGSKDKTKQIALKNGVRVLEHKKNMGKGVALKTGFKYFLKKSNVDVIIVADSDRQYSVKDTVKLLKPIKTGKADYVVGCRDWKKVPFRHRMGNFVWRTFFNILFGVKLKDTNCGLIAMKTDVAKIMKIRGGGYVIDNYMLIQAIKNGFKIMNIPISIDYKHKRDFFRGTKMVVGVAIFILKEGIKYNLNKL